MDSARGKAIRNTCGFANPGIGFPFADCADEPVLIHFVPVARTPGGASEAPRYRGDERENREVRSGVGRVRIPWIVER